MYATSLIYTTCSLQRKSNNCAGRSSWRLLIHRKSHFWSLNRGSWRFPWQTVLTSSIRAVWPVSATSRSPWRPDLETFRKPDPSTQPDPARGSAWSRLLWKVERS